MTAESLTVLFLRFYYYDVVWKEISDQGPFTMNMAHISVGPVNTTQCGVFFRVLFPLPTFFPATMFAARVRASLKPLLHGRHSSSLNRNRTLASYYSTFISIFFQIFESAGNETISKWLIRGVLQVKL